MNHTSRATRRRPRRRAGDWGPLVLGLGVSVLVTLAGVAVFALLMQFIRPSDGVIRVFNQVLKLVSISVGTAFVVRRTGGGLLQGALIGLVYMLIGVGSYTLLTGQGLMLSSMLADLGMGVAGGGIIGMLLGKSV